MTVLIVFYCTLLISLYPFDIFEMFKFEHKNILRSPSPHSRELNILIPTIDYNTTIFYTSNDVLSVTN